jgi:hypothetical protein
MSSTLHRWPARAAFIIGTFAALSLATAQDAAAPAAEEELEEVIVTGVARPVNRLETSISVSALNL